MKRYLFLVVAVLCVSSCQTIPTRAEEELAFDKFIWDEPGVKLPDSSRFYVTTIVDPKDRNVLIRPNGTRWRYPITGEPVFDGVQPGMKFIPQDEWIGGVRENVYDAKGVIQ